MMYYNGRYPWIDASAFLCHELGHFIKYANGVQDADFRCSGICPFEPVPPVGRKEYAFPERAAVRRLPTPEVSTSREMLKEYLQERMLDETFIQGTVDEDLEVKIGFQTGLGSRAGHDEWYSAYLYCRQCGDVTHLSKTGPGVFHSSGLMLETQLLFTGVSPI